MQNSRNREIYNELRQEELRRDVQAIQNNNNAIGILVLFAAFIALGLGAFALFANRQVNNPAPRNNTIIERTRDVVPVPQPQAPVINPPDIKINVPNPAPTAPSSNTAPAPNTNEPAPSPSPANP